MRVTGILTVLCFCFAVNAVDISKYALPGQGASAVSLNGVIYITGGLKTEPLCLSCPGGGNYESFSSRIQVYQPTTQAFDVSLPNMTYERAWHTAVLYKDSIVVFGGAGSFNILEQFNITTSKWSVITPTDDGYSWTPLGEKPSGRWGHGAAVVDDHMYIFGGFDFASGNALNDFWTFDFVTSTWKSWEVYGWAPQPRGGFSLSAGVIGNEKVLVLFGGLDSSTPAKYFNDLWVFKINTYSWKHISVTPPPARAFHNAVVFQGDQLVIYGGSAPNGSIAGVLSYFDDVWTVSILRPQQTRKWSQVKVSGDLPEARDDAVVAIYQDNLVNHTFYLFSGMNDARRDTLADVWKFELTVDPADVVIDGTEITQPEFGPGNGNINITAAKLYRFDRFFGTFTPLGCFDGYYYPGCYLDCSANNWCSGNGQCQLGGTCCCDDQYSGSSCNVTSCTGYKAFTPHELNKILLPAAIRNTMANLAALSAKLAYLQDTLPVLTYSQVNVTSFAASTHEFSETCMTGELFPQIGCFENVVGCDVPCGDETPCWEGDTCINGQCIGGAPVNCSGLLVGTSSGKCSNAWCDAVNGECQVSTVNCDDEDPCTEDSCDPLTGQCVHSANSACDDESCCTFDYCDSSVEPFVCVHTSKCEDMNPCTVDSCCETCSFGTCSYAWEDQCYLSIGQNTQLLPEDPSVPRSNGNPIVLNAANVVAIPAFTYVNATAFFWLQTSVCELVYQIEYDSKSLPFGYSETGAFFYGNAKKNENAGVVHSLPLGSTKLGSWHYCDDGVTVESIRNGEIYVEIYFNREAIRAQVEFYAIAY